MQLMSQVLTYSTVVFSNGKRRDNPLKINENLNYSVSFNMDSKPDSRQLITRWINKF